MKLLRMRRGAASIGLIGLGLVVGMFAAGEVAKGKIEQGVSAMIPTYLGPADYYRTRVNASPFDLLGEKATSVHIVGANVKTSMGVTIDKLDIVMRNISFDSGSRSLRSVGQTQVTAEISADNFLQYAAKAYPDITEPAVTFTDGSFSLKARPMILGVKPSVAGEGHLEIADGKLVNVRLTKVVTVGISAPGFVRGWLENRLNPVFNAETFGYNLTLDSVEIKPGFVVMRGKADMTAEALENARTKSQGQ